MPSHRISCLDTLRGLTIISMVAFHTTYDLVYLYGMPWPFFTVEPWQDIWRDSISWTFLFLAGWMTFHSRNNLKRAVRYGAAAFLVFAVTTVAAVDTPINFGILFCMAASTALFAIIAPYLKRINPIASCLGCLFLFALTYMVPRQPYPVVGLSWLGFPSPTFTSGDYYPMIPFTFMYLAGACAVTAYMKRHASGYPSWMSHDFCPPVTWVGRHSLLIYLAHQPIVLLAITLFMR